jgi:hypothetical protein
MGHKILTCHAQVVRSFFILYKVNVFILFFDCIVFLCSIKLKFQANFCHLVFPFYEHFYVPYKPIGATPQRHFFGGEGGVWYEKGVTLCGLRISEKKEILCKLTVL